MSEGHEALDPEGPQKRAAERADRERGEMSLEQLDILWLMGEASGRRIAYRILHEAGVYRMSYVQGDPHQTSFQEGRRDIGNRWLSRFIADAPEQYALMLKENNNAR